MRSGLEARPEIALADASRDLSACCRIQELLCCAEATPRLYFPRCRMGSTEKEAIPTATSCLSFFGLVRTRFSAMAEAAAIRVQRICGTSLALPERTIP